VQRFSLLDQLGLPVGNGQAGMAYRQIVIPASQMQSPWAKVPANRREGYSPNNRVAADRGHDAVSGWVKSLQGRGG
jgi:hypothetical protein